ncbi:VWA domain-containing protein [Aeoliella sp.]|uniref:VWA domain-containing protein n=1 Tax=Aeoliella sp. TaxID=2795800 RepID=UPI003CCB84D3
MLTFNYLWIFLLLPLPWGLRALLPASRAQRVSVRVPFGDRLAQTLKQAGDSTDRQPQRLVVPSLLWLLVLAALARPQWIEPPVTQERPTRDLLLLVDLSASMQQEDFESEAGEKVDRLAAVKQVLGDFLERRDGDRVGLVVFGDAPYLQAPFSTDLDLVRRLLDECQVGMAGPRTALGDAIGLGVNLFDESDATAKTIIALTDGNDTKSLVPPVEAARVAAQRGIHIHTVAIGDATTVGEDKLDEQALRDVANAADGKYFFAADRQSLEGIYDELDKIETRKVKTVSHRPRHDLFYWPIAAALLLSLLQHVYLLLQQRRITPARPNGHTIHVNPATGKLELVT